MKVDSDKFLTELNKLYEKSKNKGSIYVTFKRSECGASLLRSTPNLYHRPVVRLAFIYILLSIPIQPMRRLGRARRMSLG